MRMFKITAVAPVVICLALLQACGGGGDGPVGIAVPGPAPENPVPPVPSSSLAPKQKWETVRLAAHEFTLRRSCFCPPESPIRLQVSGGVLLQALYTETGKAVSAEQAARLPTIDGLFTLIDQAYAKGAYSVDVTSNASYGYPEKLSIDYDRLVVDEELFYTVSDFRWGTTAP